jgi:hypothetical protein
MFTRNDLDELELAFSNVKSIDFIKAVLIVMGTIIIYFIVY